MGCSIDSAINYSDMLECPQPAVGGEWQAIPGKEAIPCIIILMTWCYWANTLSVIDITISDQSFRGGHVWKHYLSRGSFCALFSQSPAQCQITGAVLAVNGKIWSNMMYCLPKTTGNYRKIWWGMNEPWPYWQPHRTWGRWWGFCLRISFILEFLCFPLQGNLKIIAEPFKWPVVWNNCLKIAHHLFLGRYIGTDCWYTITDKYEEIKLPFIDP